MTDHIDLHAVKLIKDILADQDVEITGQQAVDVWFALQPIIGHIIRTESS